jgi:uncharacterized membrane protein
MGIIASGASRSELFVIAGGIVFAVIALLLHRPVGAALSVVVAVAGAWRWWRTRAGK